MNAAETIAAAIEKLEAQRSESTSGTWEYVSEPFGAIFTEQEPGLGVQTEVAEEMHDADGLLIVTLHRTIDAQLAILRRGLAKMQARYALTYDYADILDLACAILGES